MRSIDAMKLPPPDPSKPSQRQMIVIQVRDLMEERYPGCWNDRCPEVACQTVYALRQYDFTGYRIAAGRLEEHGPQGVLLFFCGTEAT